MAPLPDKSGFAEEAARQQALLALRATTNYCSRAVLEAQGSVFTSTLSEDIPTREQQGRTVAGQAFATDYHSNLQPLTGTLALQAVTTALAESEGPILSFAYTSSSQHTYGVDATGLLNYQELEEKVQRTQPKLVVFGAVPYPMLVDYARLAAIAHSEGAYLLVDCSQRAGLIISRLHPTPFGQADIIVGDVAPALRGGRGGFLFCQPELGTSLDEALLSLQGKVSGAVLTAAQVMFEEANQPSFVDYNRQATQNAQTLAYGLQRHGFHLLADGTDTHLCILDLQGTGLSEKEALKRLEAVGISCQTEKLPPTEASPHPVGLLVSTLPMTTRGMKEKEFDGVATVLANVLTEPDITEAQRTVHALTRKFRIPGYDSLK